VRPDGLPDIDWVQIPAGRFKYGGDPGAQNSAEAQEIDLPTFYIARYPITYSQFQTFLDAWDGIQNDRWWEGLAQEFREPFVPKCQSGNHPREMVSWHQAVAFCRWLSCRLGGPYTLDQIINWAVRLPTEQEWEKAARHTDGRIYPWGNEYIPGAANVDETESGAGPYWQRTTTAVGIYLPGASPYGVMDMIGNVWEWCLTEQEPYKHYDPTTIGILRGGSWMSPVEGARVARRYRNVPGLRRIAPGPGFRVVCASLP
jgi:formylglycine-generating enzyme required for sulfatase activity